MDSIFSFLKQFNSKKNVVFFNFQALVCVMTNTSVLQPAVERIKNEWTSSIQKKTKAFLSDENTCKLDLKQLRTKLKSIVETHVRLGR